ncbi:hypothetical protein [Armatimonas sp.]|uniref:hypothetical protein n=1 Tax=Armatimonas sp. TaxID=1872638 RepID=UPI003750E036
MKLYLSALFGFIILSGCKQKPEMKEVENYKSDWKKRFSDMTHSDISKSDKDKKSSILVNEYTSKMLEFRKRNLVK